MLKCNNDIRSNKRTIKRSTSNNEYTPSKTYKGDIKSNKDECKESCIDWAKSALYISIRRRLPLNSQTEDLNYEFQLDKIISLLEQENVSVKELRKFHRKGIRTLQELIYSLSLEQHLNTLILNYQHVFLLREFRRQ